MIAYVHLYSAFIIQHARKHSYALFGKNVGAVLFFAYSSAF